LTRFTANGQRPPANCSRGFTLVELLVVVTIMLLLVMVGVPAIRMPLESRRTREAARSLDVFISAARLRALETGRPAGVIFHRGLGPIGGKVGAAQMAPNACIVCYQAEVPPPYAGDMTGETIALTPDSQSGAWKVTFPMGGGGNWPTLVHAGDLLQLNFQGFVYLIGFPTGNANVISLTNTTLGGTISFGSPANTAAILARGLPFQVFRQPTRSSARPLQLPPGIVIDLDSSGTEDLSAAPPTNIPFGPSASTYDVVVTFSPSGAVDRVWCDNISAPNRLMQPLYLLVGKRERMSDVTPPADNLPNWQDFKNLWMKINPQTGMLSTAELGWNVNDKGEIAPGPPPTIFASRNTIRSRESMGGR
jgi:prepilin-type N-terminal cleavage/methylation domain-containing protein